MVEKYWITRSFPFAPEFLLYICIFKSCLTPVGSQEDGDDEKDKGETTADGTAKTKKKKKKKKKAAEEGGTAEQVTWENAAFEWRKV